MKWLVFVGCAFVFESMRIILAEHGFRFGAIPLFFIYGGIFTISQRAGEKWAANKFKKKAAEAGMTPAEYAMNDIPKMFLLEIQDRIETNNGLSGYLKMCVKEKIVTKEQADAILDYAQNLRKG